MFGFMMAAALLAQVAFAQTDPVIDRFVAAFDASVRGIRAHTDAGEAATRRAGP
jgi:hypothetical protein